MKKNLLLGTALVLLSLQTAFAAALTLPTVNYWAAEVRLQHDVELHDVHGIGLQPAIMLADTMPVGAMTYNQIRNYFMGGCDYRGQPQNNGFISTMPLANDDYTSPYNEHDNEHEHTQGVRFEQKQNGDPLTKAEQLDAFRRRLHEVWRKASHYRAFEILITTLYNVANAYRMQQTIDRTAFDKEFILTLFTSSTIAYLGERFPIPGSSCGQGAVERITMELSTYRYLEHFPAATREMADALKSLIGFFNAQGGINSLIEGNNWVDYCDNFGPVQLAVTRQQKLDALMTQCINGFFKIISANNANMDAYARRYPQKPINFYAYDPSTREYSLIPGAPKRITFEAAIRSALKQYGENLTVDYNEWLDFAETEIRAGHTRGAKLRTAAPQIAAPQVAAPQIDMARYTVPDIQFNLEEIIASGTGTFMYQGREIQPQGWDSVMATLRPVLEASGGIPDAFNGLAFSATSCSNDYVIFTTNHPFFHAVELLVRHEDIPGRSASFTQRARQQHADPQAVANNMPLDAASRALRAMGAAQPDAVVQPVVLPDPEEHFPVVSFTTITLNGEYQDDMSYCDVNDRYISNHPFGGYLLGQNGEADLILDIAAEPMENGAVLSCNELLSNVSSVLNLEATYPGLGAALRSNFARGRSIAFFRFNAATMNAALPRSSLENDCYMFTIGNVRTTGAFVPTQPAVQQQPVMPQQPAVPQFVVRPEQPVMQERPVQPVMQEPVMPQQPAVPQFVVRPEQPVMQERPVQPVMQEPVARHVQPVAPRRTADVINAEIENLSASFRAAPPATKRAIGQQIQELRAELAILA
jgi:hypothetical protein